MLQAMSFLLNMNESCMLETSFIDTDYLFKFPEPVAEYNGACLVSREINAQLLYSAYMQGVFPWFDEDEGEPVVWYSPDPRFCLRIENLHVPKSLDRFLKHTPYTYTMDSCFVRVMEECRAMKRDGQDGTWIGSKMINAYSDFHKAGFAHSFEVWHEETLVGGFYGVLVGSVFCGESMFTKWITVPRVHSFFLQGLLPNAVENLLTVRCILTTLPVTGQQISAEMLFLG